MKRETIATPWGVQEILVVPDGVLPPGREWMLIHLGNLPERKIFISDVPDYPTEEELKNY